MRDRNFATYYDGMVAVAPPYDYNYFRRKVYQLAFFRNSKMTINLTTISHHNRMMVV